MMTTGSNRLRNLGLAALASTLLGGCYYGDIYGSSSYAANDCAARYGDEYWSNDPYAYDDATYGYDCYDIADYHSGFVQIGFGGGWYDSYYYPGYGLFLYDRYGRRHGMDHNYLTYWGGRRAWWKHHGRRHHDRGRDHDRADRPRYPDSGWRPGKGRGDGSGAAPPPGFPGGRRDGDWTAADGSETPRGRPRGEGYQGRPRRGGGGGSWTPPPAGNGSVAATPRAPRSSAPPAGNGRSAATPRSASAPRAAPPTSPPPAARPAPPPRDPGGRVRED